MLKYIGPFLRTDKLTIEQIQSQLFHLSKESIKNIVFYSKCGIKIKPKALNLKDIPSTDITTLNSNSPLLCIYKRSKASLKNKNNILLWTEDKIKKDIYICSNGYMTLCLLELIDYYKKFKDISPNKYYLNILYTTLVKKQLEFYASYLRNEEGVFVDKKDCSDPITDKIQLKNKNKTFNFSDQAILMNAYYKCSTYLTGKSKESFESFSKDILKMFLDFKEELYNISFQEQCKVCLNLNIFYTYSKIDTVKPLLLDMFDFIYENYKNNIASSNNISNLCLLYLNSYLLYKHTKIDKFKSIGKEIFEKIKKFYSEDYSLFIKYTEKKEIKLSCKEIVLYLISTLCKNKLLNLEEDDDDSLDIKDIIINVFTNELIDSGIILSWPEAPNLDDIERYKDFLEKSENLLTEQYFKMPTIASPESNNSPSIFIKSVEYSKNKRTFKEGKPIFDSRKNLELFFLILYFLSHELK